jgi:hypothetical protein
MTAQLARLVAPAPSSRRSLAQLLGNLSWQRDGHRRGRIADRLPAHLDARLVSRDYQPRCAIDEADPVGWRNVLPCKTGGARRRTVTGERASPTGENVSPHKIAVVVGSNRNDSINPKLAQALIRLARANLAWDVLRIDDCQYLTGTTSRTRWKSWADLNGIERYASWVRRLAQQRPHMWWSDHCRTDRRRLWLVHRATKYRAL